ncbi:hypothetical protein PENSTE_c013G06156 [Penicillium steckii]|uniref:Mid2 domain-containing protein n=1 Tax=Penicillium steckii TaxID=303698 RepID=A0A1V6T307_9EURO|nr:hypothetical protein PENSTE_c013G06156 [Penicillium steckii]
MSDFTHVQPVTLTNTGSSVITLTSFLTETIHPIQTYTDVTTISDDPVTTTQPAISQLITTSHLETIQLATTLSQSHLPQTPWPESIQSETQQPTAQQTTPSPTPIVISGSPWTTSESSVSSVTELKSPLMDQSSTHAYSIASESSSLSVSPSTTLLELSSGKISMTTQASSNIFHPYGSQISQAITSSQESTSIQSFTTFSTSSSRSSTSPSTGAKFGSAGSSQSTSTSSRDSSHRVGTIVGSVIGGTVFIVLALLACFLFRRRRRNSLHRRQHSRQTLLRTDSDNSTRAFLHDRQSSWPLPHSNNIPSAPVFPAQRNHLNTNIQTFAASAVTNQDMSPGGGYFNNDYQKRYTDEPFSNHHQSPVIEVSPPTRSASVYSRSSWEGRSKSLEPYVSPSPGSRAGSAYFPGESTTTLPDSGSDIPDSRHLFAPKRRASIRSNPFDLEAPPSAASKDPMPQILTGASNPAWYRWY